MKKTITSLFILFIAFFSKSIAQTPNLILSSGSVQSKSLNAGNYLSITFRVKNIGNSIAKKSHTGIYINTTASFTNAIYLSSVSCEALAANQETQDVKYVFPLPYNVSAGTNYVLLNIDNNSEVAESDELNGYNLNSTFFVGNSATAKQNLPYPILLIHGLNGTDTTWYPFLRNIQTYYGYSYGGNLDFCLNQDNDITQSYLPTDFKDWTDTNNLVAGDYYTINFDVSTLGSKYSSGTESNQAAILKQGVAVKYAIQHISNATGRNKVLLIGHSMGGLAAREYLQNPINWQSDGQHHIAKLFTLGTPHGGSNSTMLGLGFNGLDEKSEAVRDLRRTYLISGDSGVYLFGGIESNSVMNNNLFFNYRNVDVNCNGVIGNNIVGLNQKSIPTDIPFTSIIGNDTYTPGFCSNCDGVVNFTSADLNNFLPQANADTFFCVGSGRAKHPWHLDLPQQTAYMFKGADEPDLAKDAFSIRTGNYYFGHFTQKNAISASVVDSDYYKFNLSQSGTLNLEAFNIPIPNCIIKIVNANFDSVCTIKTNGKGYLSQSNIAVSSGTYYMNVFGIPNDDSWYFPYAFKLGFAPSILPLQLLSFSASLLGNETALRWSTVGEYNTTKFSIERSNDQNSWQSIGTVNSNNLLSKNDYSFIDVQPKLGLNYYRLKMLDKDNKYNYSEVKSVVHSAIEQPFVISPNPSVNYTYLSFSTSIKTAEIEVFDVQGKKVFTDTYTATEKLTYKLKTDNFSTGTYIVNIKTNLGNYSSQLIITKK